MAYDYYRNSGSGWGTSQFQFASPPAPPFRPQSSWGGMDYYNAHAINADPSLFHSVMSRMGQVGSVGPGRREARYWHQRVYSGMSPLTQLLPVDIGAAAAYEAYRTWKHNSFLHEPLGSDPLRMREGLVGMAIAETTRLWQYAGRPMDTFGLRAASEAAASVATVLSERLMEWTGGGAGTLSSGNAGLGGYRPRRSSFHVPSVIRSGGSQYLGAGAPGIPGGPPTMTAGGMGGLGMGVGGGSSRASSVFGGGAGPGYSPSMSPSPMPGMMAGGGMGGGTMGGAMGAGMGGGMMGGGMGGGAMGGGMGGGFAPGPMPVPGAGSGMGAGAGMGGASMGPGAMGAGGMPPGGAYGSAGLGAGGVGGAYGTGAGQYGGAGAGAYGGAPGGAVPFPGGGQGQQPGSTVIIQDERSHRRPRARRYSDSYTDRPRRRRSPSFERPPVGYGAGGGYAGVGAGGGYGAGAPGMVGGGYGASGGMYGAGAGAGMGGAGMGGAGMGGAGMGGTGMGGAYGGPGMGGAYGAQGGYGGAPGYGGMPGGAGGYGGMPGAYGGTSGSSSSGYGGERSYPGGPFSRAREAAEEEESEEEEMGGGRFGGLAQKFRAGMGMGLNATGLGRRGD